MCSLVWLKEDPYVRSQQPQTPTGQRSGLSPGGVISGPHPYSQPLPGTAVQSQEKADPGQSSLGLGGRSDHVILLNVVLCLSCIMASGT